MLLHAANEAMAIVDAKARTATDIGLGALDEILIGQAWRENGPCRKARASACGN